MVKKCFGVSVIKPLIIGFDDTDHVIRELMRFIDFTSRKYTIEDVT
jgi:hypothetical protein